MGRIWSEQARLTTAKALDTYRDGRPAWTRNEWGGGTAHYLTTLPADLSPIMARVCEEAGVTPAAQAPPGVEVVRRTHPDGRSYLFAINHTDEDAVVEGVAVPAGDVVVTGP
ncbi:Beta-galactosidase C-terminal domain [Nonomuraea recticatena]|uniref:Beta-galactosidase C-terminal domain n=1 Tax=Nonomuraea recticatena TaxID=46178 RepID=UPI003618D9E2